MLRWETKYFNELSTQELYALLQLRSEVFVVEQDCVYQDLDGKDDKALHVLGYKEEVLVAYARCFAPGDYYKESSFGRIIIAQNQRKYGYGHELIKVTAEVMEQAYKTNTIRIAAQCYLIKFYEQHDFVIDGKEYLEDGIPHIEMIKAN